MTTEGSDVPVETGFQGVVNAPDPGWVELYTRDGSPRRVPATDVQKAMVEEGLIPVRYDIDQATSECVAAHLGAADAILKAVAEIKATGGQRDEDSWIIAAALGAARDTGVILQYALGAQVPTEAFIAALKEHELIYGQGGTDENDRVKVLIDRHRVAIDALPDDRLEMHRQRASADQAVQAGSN